MPSNEFVLEKDGWATSLTQLLIKNPSFRSIVDKLTISIESSLSSYIADLSSELCN